MTLTEALADLRATLTPDRTLYFIARHTSRSGRQELGVMLCDQPGGPIDLSPQIARVLDLPIGREQGVVAPPDVTDAPSWIAVQVQRACGLDHPVPVSWL